MTGYGKVSFADEGVLYLLEIHSVNRKNLDMSIFLPREMLPLDIELRKWVGEHVKRGQVTIKLTKDMQADALEGSLPDASLLRAFKKSWENLANELGYDRKELSLTFLMSQLEHLPKSHRHNLEAFSEKLKQAFQEAVTSFINMKHIEGLALAQEISKSLSKIKEEVSSIGDYATEISEEYRKKLESKLREFDLAHDDLKEKIAREVVLYADKGDITEEIGRLSAHIKSFEDKMMLEDSIGKTLDFIILEMNREANTMAAKSQNLKVTSIALSIKSEIEKIREQIQNIE